MGVRLIVLVTAVLVAAAVRSLLASVICQEMVRLVREALTVGSSLVER